jgi:hypothetical protein
MSKEYKAIEKRLDTLWGAIVKGRADHKCQMCGTSEGFIDPHHAVKRTHKRLRWTLDNGIALCRYRCHRLAEDQPKAFDEWMEERYPYMWEELNKEKAKGVKIYNLGELVYLEETLKEILKELGSESDLPF